MPNINGVTIRLKSLIGYDSMQKMKWTAEIGWLLSLDGYLRDNCLFDSNYPLWDVKSALTKQLH